MACYFSPGPLCDSCEHCNVQKRPVYHRLPFEAISTSLDTGITFEAYKYSANQLADGFEKIIQGYTSSEIKSLALTRWRVLLLDLLDGPVWRDAEFDLEDSFHALDDFLFMRALQHRCRVEWVDECQKGWKRNSVGWCEPAVDTNEGPRCWIRVVRPTVDKPKNVEDVLCTLMHEMCHALFTFRCQCPCCCCPLNRMNGEGFDGHGPSWEKLRRCVETTAGLHLNHSCEPIPLCYGTEPQAEAEAKKVAKMLSGLYKRVTQQGSEAADLKRVERAKRRTEERETVAEIEERSEGEQCLDVLACARPVLKESELLSA